MFSLRILLAVALSFLISCSNKTSKYPPPATPPSTTNENEKTPAAPVDIPVVEPVVGEKYIDAYTSVLIQEIKNQLATKTLSSDMRIQNVEFANRIYKINYHYGPHSQLSITTYTNKVFNFRQTSSEKNIQYFNAYEDSKDFMSREKATAAYSAQATTYESVKDKKIVTTIKIKDLETNAEVHIFYVKKVGTVTSSMLKGYDYGRELTPTSKVFLERLKKNPQVIGEFYGVITEERNVSNASRFNLTVSDSFTLESQPLVNLLHNDQPNLVPMSVDYVSFWKLLFFGSASYTVIKDSAYIIESERNPIELTALNLDIKIEGHEKIKGQKNTLPVRFFIKFK
jgi:hypothetical protein